MDTPAFDKPMEFRVIDIYRRAGDKMDFVDLLHTLKQAGIDALKRHAVMNTEA